MLLDESEKVAKQHMAMSEALQTQIAENIKTLKANKAQVFKKVHIYDSFSFQPTYLGKILSKTTEAWQQ